MGAALIAALAGGLTTVTPVADGKAPGIPVVGTQGNARSHAASALAGVTKRARPPGRCKRLRGRDIAPARRVKLVRRRNHKGGTNLLGCVGPRGRVRVLASSSNRGTTVERYRIRQVAGAIVLIATSHDSQYATDRSLSVIDVRTGRDYLIARSCSRLDGGRCGDTGAVAATAFVNRRGQACAAVVSAETDTVTIVGFSSRGRRRDLDAGPAAEIQASSLRLNGRDVTWTHSGETRTATVPG